MEVAATMPLQLDSKMEVLESALLAEFIGYIKLNWSAHPRVDQRQRRLRQLVSKVRAVVDAAEELERLAGPGSDVDVFVRVLSPDAATADDMDVDGDAATGTEDDDMDVDARPAPAARHRQEGSGRSCASAGSVAALRPAPGPGAKRKRACGGGGGEVDTVQPRKRRRLLAWTRSHQRLPSGFGRVSSAARRPPSPALRRSRPARTVALAMSKIRRRIGKPTATRHRPQPSLGQHFSRITL